jgi:transposase-like protein
LGREGLTTKTRIPEAVADIQVNFCKNPTCLNFGRPASTKPQPRGPGAKERGRDPYVISTRHQGSVVFLRCQCCGETPPLKSNLGIYEEIQRITAYLLDEKLEPCCPETGCPNHGTGISIHGAYYSFGKTRSGSQRYRCRRCSKTFSVGPSTLRQKRPEINELTFNLLVNKMPFKRICETVGISMKTLYGKINFIHQQCLAFAAEQERTLPELDVHRFYVSVDRQDHIINWSQANDKRNIILSALGSADNVSGFVFGVHVNYDSRLSQHEVEQDAKHCGDEDVKPPFRRYARLWLEKDYDHSLARNIVRRTWRKKNDLKESILEQYDHTSSREDVESPDLIKGTTSLPRQGLMVHSEYTLYAHFFFLQRMLRNVGKVRFYLDQESGIRAACLAAFQQEVLEKRCDAFFVRVNKTLTINEKRRLKAQSTRDLEVLRKSDPGYALLSDFDLRLIVIQQRMKNLVDIGPWHDRWLVSPFPDMSEPEKAICWLTDLKDRAYSEEQLARLYARATLHGIDRFFMQVRRRLSLLERPIASASSEGRKWHGYSAYNPAMVGKLLDIFRVFYNYVAAGDDKKTPAMRIRIARAPISIHEIIQAKPTAKQ